MSKSLIASALVDTAKHASVQRQRSNCSANSSSCLALHTNAHALLVRAEAVEDTCIHAIFAFCLVVLEPAVGTNAAAPTFFALVSDLTMTAQAAAATFFALVFQLAVGANAAATAVFALALHLSVFANAVALALFALVLDPAVLTNLRIMLHISMLLKRNCGRGR